MKKMLFLMLFLLILGAASVNSQVRIGGNSQPDPAAVLDLNADDDATPSDNKGALALPRVNLTSATMQLNSSTPVNGMLIYNTGTTFAPGVYVWVIDKWVKADVNPLKITEQPAPFTWRRKQDATADPNGPALPVTVNLNVTASGSGTLTYAWYEKPKNQNVTARGTVLGATAYYTPSISDWGMHTYYCVVSNGVDSVVSNYADVAIGCGAKTMDGRWLSFMCYNLGADPGLDPFTYTSLGDTTSFDSKGWLFQWGRGKNTGYSDGHQWRSSVAVPGPVYLPGQDQVPATGTSGTSVSLGIATTQSYADYYGKFISTSDYEYFHDWRTPQISWLWYSYKSLNDPCPTGWQIPTQTDIATLLSANTSSRQFSRDAIANTWIWSTSGLQVKPDGTTTTLFFPAAGTRDQTGVIVQVGSSAQYWTSTAQGSNTVSFGFGQNTISVGDAAGRVNARSVRCVKQT